MGFVNGWVGGVAESDRRLEFHFLPTIGGWSWWPFVVRSWLLYDYNVTMAGRVRAARVRCGRSSLRGVAWSDRRRRRVLLRLVRGGRGRGSAAPSFDLKAGAVGGGVGCPVLLYHSMQVQRVRQRFFSLRCCSTWFSWRGVVICCSVKKCLFFLLFLQKGG